MNCSFGICRIVCHFVNCNAAFIAVFFNPTLHVVVVNYECVGIAETFHFFLRRELFAAAAAEVVNECDDFCTAYVSHFANKSVVLFYRILQHKAVAFVQTERYDAYACKGGEKTEYFVVEMGLPKGNVLEAHVLHYMLVEIFRDVSRVRKVSIVM